MVTFDALCSELFVLAQQGIDGSTGTARGRRWEEKVAAKLGERGIPVEAVPGGYRVLGFFSLSGLMHQVDATLSCADAIVLAEWKAYGGPFPKNEVLRFKAATDDYYMSFGTVGLSRPVFRLFGGIGNASDTVRQYAALHGIALIESDRWPLPTLVSDEFVWPGEPADGPSMEDRMALAWGARPLQLVMRPQASGSFLLPRPESKARVESFLRLHDNWSDRLWDAVDLGLSGPEEVFPQFQYRPSAA